MIMARSVPEKNPHIQYVFLPNAYVTQIEQACGKFHSMSKAK